ncbi:cold shock domain-containing protein [Streptomyces sp. NPDC094032]|uniref:cold-shock protein n=1 Tax=Streptomyces sp. NPDC094032 TaxID=3155308 RepID=UPI00331F303F
MPEDAGEGVDGVGEAGHGDGTGLAPVRMVSAVSRSGRIRLIPTWTMKGAGMPNGTVTMFNDAKGYGTIRSDDGEEFPVHHTEIISNDSFRTLAVNARVVFGITEGPNGRRAAQVMVVG